MGSTNSSDDAGYESLHQHQEAYKAARNKSNVMGIESSTKKESTLQKIKSKTDFSSKLS